MESDRLVGCLLGLGQPQSVHSHLVRSLTELPWYSIAGLVFPSSEFQLLGQCMSSAYSGFLPQSKNMRPIRNSKLWTGVWSWMWWVVFLCGSAMNWWQGHDSKQSCKLNCFNDKSFNTSWDLSHEEKCNSVWRRKTLLKGNKTQKWLQGGNVTKMVQSVKQNKIEVHMQTWHHWSGQGGASRETYRHKAMRNRWKQWRGIIPGGDTQDKCRSTNTHRKSQNNQQNF